MLNRIESHAHPIAGILVAQGRKGTWLAAETGVSQSYASLMVRNKRPATAAFRVACAKALGLPEDVLFHKVTTTPAESAA
jgi:hypothetical protein